MSWIGFDLDGTLAEYDEKDDSGGAIGKPIKAMVDRVKALIDQGEEVRIFTARAGDSSEVKKVKEWLKENGLDGLKVTNVKDSGMKFHFDDKAIRVVRNTGELCSGCEASATLKRLSLASRYSLRRSFSAY